MFTHIETGHGMYENDVNKTWVDVGANSASSFFAIGSPQNGQYGYDAYNSVETNRCELFSGLISFPFPCCFLFETTAAICRDNPGLTDGSNDELIKSYIELSVESNTTILIDSAFKVDLTYNQAFFPLSFGQEIYQGYTLSLDLDCQDITIFS